MDYKEHWRNMINLHNLQQNTPEWLQFRKNKIGASDAPTIMKVGFKTPYQLWQQKLGFVEPEAENYAQAEGKRKEPIALAALQDKLGIALEPSIRLHNQRSWMMASLDAFDERSCTVGEIKCPGKEDHNLALAGQVPEKYYPQLQHQIEVCNVDWVYYYSYAGEDNALLVVNRDDKYIKKLLIEEEKFFECMMNFEAPELCDRDYTCQDSARWAKLAEELQQIKLLKGREEEIKQELIALANGRNSRGAGITLAKCVRKGSVDYSKVPELVNVDLDPYRKKSSEYWRIT